MKDLATELERAKEAVRAAARLAQRVAPTPDGVLTKEDLSPVTVADYGAQALICATLAEAFPDDPVIGEEGAAELRERAAIRELVLSAVRAERPTATAAEVCTWIDRGSSREFAPRVWMLDPIDGTKGYVRGGHYAVALALTIDASVEVAVIACPRLNLTPGAPEPTNDSPCGALVWAVRGQGAFLEPLGGGAAQRLSVSTRAASESVQLESYEPGHHDRERAGQARASLGVAQPPTRLDSMVKYVLLARGDAELYLRLTPSGYRQKVWDHAAGALILEEAGGRVSDLSGAPLDFSQGACLAKDGGLVATSGQWHQRVLDVL